MHTLRMTKINFRQAIPLTTNINYSPLSPLFSSEATTKEKHDSYFKLYLASNNPKWSLSEALKKIFPYYYITEARFVLEMVFTKKS